MAMEGLRNLPEGAHMVASIPPPPGGVMKSPGQDGGVGGLADPPHVLSDGEKGRCGEGMIAG